MPGRQLITLLIALCIAAPINAASKRQCRQQCAPRIASCIADGTKPKRCRKTIIKTCRRRGLENCVVGAPTLPPPPPTSQTGSLSVHVIDPFGGAIAGANVQLTGREGTRTLQTGSDGSASASDIAAGSTTVRAVHDGFDAGQQNVVVQPAQVADVRLTLQPQSLPSVSAGRSTVLSGVGTSTADFEVEVYAVAADGQPLALTPRDFTIADADTSFAGRLTFQQLAVTTANKAALGDYSATMLLDQSGSIDSTDPADSRIQAAKIFMNALGPGDFTLLSAFASGNSTLGNDVVYWGTFTHDGSSYFGQLDALADTVGGGTPLYKATVLMIDHAATTAPTSNKAVVVFTDGEDTDGSYDIDDIAREATTQGVRVFPVGLSSGTDTGVLAEIAQRTGGAAFWSTDARRLVSYYKTLGNILRGSATVYQTRWRMTRSTGVFSSRGAITYGVSVNTPGGSGFAPFYLRFP
jgi:hypothetical protein